MTLSKFTNILLVSLMLMMLVSSCASQATPAAPVGSSKVGVSSPLAAPAAPPLSAQAGSSSDVPPVQQRLTVRTVSMHLVVDKVRETVDKITELTGRLEGFVVSSQINQNDEETAMVSIRVPSQRADEAVKALRGFAIRVLDENQKAQDITEEFTDLQARLRNLQVTEAKLLSLLNETRTVNDTLQVQRELSNVRGQIEQLQGRIQYLNRTSATSLISVTLEPAVGQKPLVQQGWNFVEIVKSSFRGLIVTLQVLGIIAIWIILFVPVWGGALAVVIYLRRRRRNKIAKQSPIK
mgnify:CR=1 FL=1